MKTFRTKLKNSFIVALALTSLSTWAKPIAQVQEVKGIAFVISPTGETKKISSLDIIDERAEILVEEGGQISLNDYYNASYHLTGGSHIKLYDRSIQLKKGKTWVKSLSRNSLALSTANGSVEYGVGQFITTFDQVSNRSQVLVVHGEVEVANILDQNLRYTVNQGDFTVIDPEVDNGLPRAPTKVGMASLNAALEDFKMSGDRPLVASTSAARSIASVRPLETVPAKKGEIIFISSSALPKEVQIKKNKRTPASLSPKKSEGRGPAAISYFGINKKPTLPVARIPASSNSASSQAVEVDSRLKSELNIRPSYSNDLEDLIFDLKSY